MSKRTAKKSTRGAPVYFLDLFSRKAGNISFYMERFKDHVKDHAFINRPHRHDFYMILFVRRGSGTHTIDFETYDVAPDTVFAMTPGQVHSWSLSDDTDGYILFFQPEFYQMQWHEDALVKFPFFHSLNASPCIRVKTDQLVDLALEEMHAEFSRRDETDLRMLRAYLDIILLKLARHYGSDKNSKLNPTIYKLRRLEELIEKNFIKLKHPSDYAALMHLTPSYLNSICKSNLGKTLSDLIHDRIVLEAKRLFSYTDLTVKEVSLRLGYADNAYFARFFKKNAGITPEEFKATVIRPV